MYFVRKVFRGAAAYYQNIEKLMLAIIIVVRKLRPYFQDQKVLVKTNYHVRKFLKKTDLVGRMVSWAVRHPITLRGNMK